MKNLKKLSRTNLKEIHGGVIIGGGRNIGGCEAHWIQRSATRTWYAI
jgi:hypothetical protein